MIFPRVERYWSERINTMMTCEGKHDVRALAYTNHRGEKNIRVVRPLRLWWGSTEYHREAQWLLDVWDYERNATRTYALADVDGCAGIELLPEGKAGVIEQIGTTDSDS